jgi:hypothetical protein
VPTYNEDLSVVKNTIYASLGIDICKTCRRLHNGVVDAMRSSSGTSA